MKDLNQPFCFQIDYFWGPAIMSYLIDQPTKNFACYSIQKIKMMDIFEIVPKNFKRQI